VTLFIFGLEACTNSDDGPQSRGSEFAQAWQAGPSLPHPITNNAVAAVDTPDGVAVFSFLGLDSTKVWNGVTNAAFRWDTSEDSWQTMEPVPGPGRLASTAQVVNGLIYVIGGYTVAEDGSEESVPDVNVYDPATDSWSRAADMPLPTDDAAAGVWHGNRIVVVSGWHETGNVPVVQMFDPQSDSWRTATPIPGPPVFGHTGAVVGDHIAYVDGTAVVEGQPRFVIEESSWVGTVNALEPSTIAWFPVSPHPGPPLYRAAAASLGGYALFIGGTNNPYNYSGIGYDGIAADPLRQVLAYAPGLDRWRWLPAPPVATMDHRNAGIAGGRVFLVGGMLDGQVVSNQVWYVSVTDLLGSLD
jgi:hypothetical protein